MSATSVTLAGRRAAERLMVDACAIVRRSGPITNPDTGQIIGYADTATIYSGKCRISVPPHSTQGQPTPLGGASVVVLTPTLQVPSSVTGVRPDDLVAITAAALEAELAGRTYRVRGIGHKTHATKREFELVEVTG